MTDIEVESERDEYGRFADERFGPPGTRRRLRLADVRAAFTAGRKAQAEAERVGRAPEYAALGRLVQEHAALKAELRSIVKRIQKVLR